MLLLTTPAQGEDALSQYADALAWPEDSETAQLSFKEERTFPFRRFPKRFAGEMYRAPNGDLAIVYTEPRTLRLVIKSDQILLDEGDGQLRKLPTDGADAQAIRDLIRGDLDQLRNEWKNEASDGGLRLAPTNDKAREAIKYIDVFVADGRVREVAVHQRNQVVRRYQFGELTHVTGNAAILPFAEE